MSFDNQDSNDNDDDEEEDENNFSHTQLVILCVTARLAAVVSGLCAIRIGMWAWQRRHRSSMFHRFMLGMSVHLVNFSAWHVVGSAAIPHGTDHSWGAYGNTATCTTQGANLQVSTFSVGCYYVALSLYSTVAVRRNFVTQQYAWMEPWMHVSVHLFPLASTIYLAHQQAFNNGGNSAVCWIDSLPHGCGESSRDDPDYVPCTRGPSNIARVSMWIAGIPMVLILVVPTVVMAHLYRYVQRHQATVRLAARSVAQQSALYLLALYWSFAFPLINNSLIKFLGKEVFVASFLSNVNVNLLGVWMLLIYRHFSVKDSGVGGATAAHHGPPSPTGSTTVQQEVCDGDDGTPENPAKAPTTKTTNPRRAMQPEQASHTTTQPSRPRPRPRTACDFNIFDGSNATGDFASFVYAADSDDEAADAAESRKWADVQEYA